MKTNIFTKEFYSHLFEKIEAEFPYVEHCEYNGYNYGFDVDGYYIELDIYFAFEWQDDSFDHAFGTWHDPFAGYAAVGVEKVENVEVFKVDTDEKIEGFDCDEFIETIYGKVENVKVS